METSRQARKRAAAPGGRSFFPVVSDGALPEVVAVTVAVMFAYIMAAGGAGSSGLPAFESGNLTSRVPSKRMMIEPTM